MTKELSVEQVTKIEKFLGESRKFERKFWQAQKDFEDRIKTQSPVELSQKPTDLPQGLLLDTATSQKAHFIMEATGISSERDAIILVFCRYQPEFLRWWNGDTSVVANPLFPESKSQ